MSAFSSTRRDAVTERAGHRCEYCYLPTIGQVATFPIDHIVPHSAGGSHELENLALSCPHCNAIKWIAEYGHDPVTGESLRLFHPRLDSWEEHFSWDGLALQGLTACGRATVNTLQINSSTMLELRRVLTASGLFSELKHS